MTTRKSNPIIATARFELASLQARAKRTRQNITSGFAKTLANAFVRSVLPRCEAAQQVDWYSSVGHDGTMYVYVNVRDVKSMREQRLADILAAVDDLPGQGTVTTEDATGGTYRQYNFNFASADGRQKFCIEVTAFLGEHTTGCRRVVVSREEYTGVREVAQIVCD